MRIGSKKNTLLWSAVALIFIAGGVFSQGSAGADSAGSSYTEKIVFPLLTLNLCESHNRKYKVKIVKNTATVEPEPHEDFGGVVLCFDRERIGSLDAWANYDFGVAQYLFDDKPASPIGYVRPTGLVALNVDNGSIELPQSYDNIEGVEAIYPRIGFADKDEYDADF